MCIACELGYWAMVDALEAERDAANENAAAAGESFVCEAVGEAKPIPRVERTVDESIP